MIKFGHVFIFKASFAQFFDNSRNKRLKLWFWAFLFYFILFYFILFYFIYFILFLFIYLFIYLFVGWFIYLLFFLSPFEKKRHKLGFRVARKFVIATKKNRNEFKRLRITKKT